MWHAQKTREKCTRFWWESLKEKDDLEDRGINGRLVLEWILGKIGWNGVEWIHLAQDRDQWSALVSAMLNLRVLAPWSLLLDWLVVMHRLF
jgi:hypothetical protein